MWIKMNLTGKQAHHIIPVEFLCELYNCEESELSEEFNEEWNCLILPAHEEQTALCHSGCHNEKMIFVVKS